MIEAHIASHSPRVLAVFSYRYDAHLVPALLENLKPLVDGWISYDDRASERHFSREVPRRLSLLKAARAEGAEWALAVDPDERFERNLSMQMPALLDSDRTVHTFALRELYGPLHYRVDGVWGQKTQARLINLRAGLREPEGDLHLSWSAFVEDPRINATGLNLYHLKMIAPARRRARAALYNQLDPEAAAQPSGYSYLAEDKGAVLERIAQGREYFPPHLEDGGLWMAPLGDGDYQP